MLAAQVLTPHLPLLHQGIRLIQQGILPEDRGSIAVNDLLASAAHQVLAT